MTYIIKKNAPYVNRLGVLTVLLFVIWAVGSKICPEWNHALLCLPITSGIVLLVGVGFPGARIPEEIEETTKIPIAQNDEQLAEAA